MGFEVLARVVGVEIHGDLVVDYAAGLLGELDQAMDEEGVTAADRLYEAVFEAELSYGVMPVANSGDSIWLLKNQLDRIAKEFARLDDPRAALADLKKDGRLDAPERGYQKSVRYQGKPARVYVFVRRDPIEPLTPEDVREAGHDW